MFENTFKNIDDILHKDAGCGSELDYVEQTSWVLFLKYLFDPERDRRSAAELMDEDYQPIISDEFVWTVWAAPKKADGELDHHKALTGDDLNDFVNGKLWPYLAAFKESADGPDTIEYKIGQIYGELKNRVQSGYNLREVINRVDELRFQTSAEKHEMSHLYEAKIQNMGNAGRNGGEYYTPRPLIRTIVIKNTFLSDSDNASVSLRKELLENCNLHTVLDLPGGTFTGAGAKTVVLFFEKGKPTKKVWFYQLNLDRNLGKTTPLNEDDLAEFVSLQKKKQDSENSWSVKAADIDTETFDLSVKNPNRQDEAVLRDPEVILAEMELLDAEAAEVLETIRGLV